MYQRDNGIQSVQLNKLHIQSDSVTARLINALRTVGINLADYFEPRCNCGALLGCKPLYISARDFEQFGLRVFRYCRKCNKIDIRGY